MSPAGASPEEAEEWKAFLGNAIGGLRLAAELLRGQRARYEAKTDWFRPRKREIPRENSVSRALAELFESARANQVIGGSGLQAVDLRHIAIECEKPRPRDPGISDESNPTDFALVLLKDRELDLRIEAKTVLGDADIRDEYLGTRGLLRFEDRTNPYTVSPYGGMVAYVVDFTADGSRSRIAAETASHVPPEHLGVIELTGIEHAVSRHVRGSMRDGRPATVDVLHFVLEIDAAPPRR